MKITKHGIYLILFLLSLFSSLTSYSQPSASLITAKPEALTGLPLEVKLVTTPSGDWTLALSNGKIWLFNTDKGRDLMVLLSPPGRLQLTTQQISAIEDWQIPPDSKSIPLEFYVLPYQQSMPVQLYKCSQWLSQKRLVCALVHIPKIVRPVESSGFKRVR